MFCIINLLSALIFLQSHLVTSLFVSCIINLSIFFMLLLDIKTQFKAFLLSVAEDIFFNSTHLVTGVLLYSGVVSYDLSSQALPLHSEGK